MQPIPIPSNESERLKALQDLQILDTDSEKCFNDLTLIANQICETPISLISLVDGHRQWFKSARGIEVTETPRKISFCGHAILQSQVFEVRDARKDPRFHDNPLVTGAPGIRFYAGAPLITSSGHAIGTICVIGTEPKALTSGQKRALETLATHTVTLIERRVEVEELKKRNKRLKALTDVMSEGVILQDSENRIIDFNPAALRLTGLTPEDLMSRTSLDSRWKLFWEDGTVITPESRPSRRVILENRAFLNVVMKIELPDGTHRWLNTNAVPLHLSGGTFPSHVLITQSDITEQKQLMGELLRSEEKFRNFFQFAPIGLVITDMNGKFLEANLAFQQMVGFSVAELRGKDTLEITHPEDKEKTSEAMDALFEFGYESAGIQKRYRSKDGKTVWTKLFNRELIAERGGGKRGLVVIEDITEKVKLEERLKEQQAQLIHSAKMSSLGEMAAGMAHEINNPLAIVMATMNYMRKILDVESSTHLDLSKLREKIELTENTVGRIAKIVKGLGSFSREGTHDPKEPVQISRIIEETLSLCQERIRSKTVDLKLDLNHDNTVLGRPGQISQVLLNLLNNSFDAIEREPNPWIELKTRTQGDLEVVSVTDSGKGIPKAMRAKIMQPFFTTKETGKGTGLGLSISKGIIEDHGGRLYYDEKSENTRFVIELPILKKATS